MRLVGLYRDFTDEALAMEVGDVLRWRVYDEREARAMVMLLRYRAWKKKPQKIYRTSFYVDTLYVICVDQVDYRCSVPSSSRSR